MGTGLLSLSVYLALAAKSTWTLILGLSLPCFFPELHCHILTSRPPCPPRPVEAVRVAPLKSKTSGITHFPVARHLCRAKPTCLDPAPPSHLLPVKSARHRPPQNNPLHLLPCSSDGPGPSCCLCVHTSVRRLSAHLPALWVDR